jgi:site-specific recombinase XerD
LRARQQAARLDEPGWMATFLDSLQRADLAAATRRGYRYDLLHFLRWQTMTLGVAGARLDRLSEPDLIAYRQAMIAAGHRPATINRRLMA